MRDFHMALKTVDLTSDSRGSLLLIKAGGSDAETRL